MWTFRGVGADANYPLEGPSARTGGGDDLEATSTDTTASPSARSGGGHLAATSTEATEGQSAETAEGNGSRICELADPGAFHDV